MSESLLLSPRMGAEKSYLQTHCLKLEDTRRSRVRGAVVLSKSFSFSRGFLFTDTALRVATLTKLLFSAFGTSGRCYFACS